MSAPRLQFLRAMKRCQGWRRVYHSNVRNKTSEVDVYKLRRYTSIRGSNWRLFAAVGVAGLACQLEEVRCEGFQWKGLSGLFSRGTSTEEDETRNPYSSPELRAGIKQREMLEKELDLFRSKARNRMKLLQARRREEELSEDAFLLEVAALKEEVLLHAQKLFYGVEQPHARERYLEEYGCVAWNDKVMQKIASFGKIIEIGAGHGQWQQELENAWGVDILAFDRGSRLPLPGSPQKGKVHTGDERMLLKYPERTLLLVYPPPGLGLSCLKTYKGDVLIYVGEGEGGVNGTKDFFEVLKRDWVVEEVMDVPNFPKCYEKAFVVRRR